MIETVTLYPEDFLPPKPGTPAAMKITNSKLAQLPGEVKLRPDGTVVVNGWYTKDQLKRLLEILA